MSTVESRWYRLVHLEARPTDSKVLASGLRYGETSPEHDPER